MTKVITAKDVAEMAEVSVVTVSRALNNHPNVTSEVRQRVLKAAADLGYQGRWPSRGQPTSNGFAPTVGGRVVREIGFLYVARSGGTGMSANPYWSHILGGVEVQARAMNLKVSYRGLPVDEFSAPALLTTLQGLRLDGVLLVGPASFAQVQAILNTKLPLVLVDNYIPELPTSTILGDNIDGAALATHVLIAQGHRRIGFLGGASPENPPPFNTIYSFEQRLFGYQMALLQAGIAYDPGLVEPVLMVPDGGYMACQRLLTRRDDFSALVCANDTIAISAMRVLREAGRRIPDDVSIIGFDDIEMAQHITPALSSVRIDLETFGREAVRVLHTRATDPEAPVLKVILPAQLVLRSSIRALS
jgi:LacI family transcriptional regulator